LTTPAQFFGPRRRASPTTGIVEQRRRRSQVMENGRGCGSLPCENEHRVPGVGSTSSRRWPVHTQCRPVFVSRAPSSWSKAVYSVLRGRSARVRATRAPGQQTWCLARLRSAEVSCRRRARSTPAGAPFGRPIASDRGAGRPRFESRPDRRPPVDGARLLGALRRCGRLMPCPETACSRLQWG